MDLIQVFYFFAVFFFILGLSIGSFINVVTLRHNSGLGLRGRSFCPHCSKSLSFWELIPLVSFLVLRGKCRGCGSAISWQYPLVELGTAVLFLLVYLKYADCWLFEGSCFSGLLTGLFFWAVFVAIFVYDLKHKIIPDTFIYPLVFLGIAYRVFSFFTVGSETLIFDLLAPFIVSVPLFLLWLISRGAWIGLGDAKLAFVFGLFLGLPGAVVSIIYAFWIGAVVSVFMIVFQKLSRYLNISLKLGSGEITMKSEIAFGPFMLFGAFLVFFLEWGLPALNLFSL